MIDNHGNFWFNLEFEIDSVGDTYVIGDVIVAGVGNGNYKSFCCNTYSYEIWYKVN